MHIEAGDIQVAVFGMYLTKINININYELMESQILGTNVYLPSNLDTTIAVWENCSKQLKLLSSARQMSCLHQIINVQQRVGDIVCH